MIENVTIIDKNGNGILAEGIMYATIKPLSNGVPDGEGKDYIFYCLNEMIDADQTKIYIAETALEAGKANPIPDSEWKTIRDLLIAISHKEIAPNVTYKKMTGVTFYISDPKKLAIKLPVKQAIKDAHFSGTLAVQQAQPSAAQGNPIFINPDNTMTDNTMTDNTMESEPNAFNVAPSSSLTNTNNVIESGAIIDPTIVTPTSPAPSINVSEGISQSNETIAPNISHIANDGPAIEENSNSKVTPEIGEPVLQEEPPLLPPEEETKDIISSVDNTSVNQTISREEAAEALKVLVQYFGLSKTIEVSDIFKTMGTDEPVIDSTLVEEKTINNNENNINNQIVEESSSKNLGVEGSKTLPEVQQIENLSTADNTINTNDENNANMIISSGDFIDTSVQGLTTESNSEIETGNYFAPVNFEIPPAPAVTTSPAVTEINNTTLQPMTAAPVLSDLDIPLAEPIAAPMQSNNEYVHVASGNQSTVALNSNIPMMNMPPVQMPDNAMGVEDAKIKMMEQGNLGPSGLSADTDKSLNLVA